MKLKLQKEGQYLILKYDYVTWNPRIACRTGVICFHILGEHAHGGERLRVGLLTQIRNSLEAP